MTVKPIDFRAAPATTTKRRALGRGLDALLPSPTANGWQAGPPPGRFDEEAPDPSSSRVDNGRERGGERISASEAPQPWASRLMPAPVEWYTTPPPKRTWLLRDKRHPKRRGVLPLGKVGQFIAAGGIGKTTTGAQLAVAVATGTPWLGCFEVASAGRVLFVVGEEDVEECQRKLYQAAQVAGVIPEAGRTVVLPLTGIHAPMIALDEYRRTIDAPFLSWLREQVLEGDYRLVIIDRTTHRRLGSSRRARASLPRRRRRSSRITRIRFRAGTGKSTRRPVAG